MKDKLIRIDAESAAKVNKLNRDANGYYATMEYRRLDDTLAVKSVASLPDVSGKYQRLTITHYGVDGISIVASEVKTVTYDDKGNVQRIE